MKNNTPTVGCISECMHLSLLQSVFEHSSDPIFIGYSNGVILDANEAACKMFGYNKPELLSGGRDAIIIQDAASTQLLSDRKINHISEGEFNYKRKNGQLFRGRVKSKTIPAQDGKEYIWVSVTDLSKEAELEHDLIHKNQELEKFAYTAAHDLQSPLKMISASLQILQKSLSENLDEESSQLMQYTLETASRMRLMVKELLEYARLGNSEIVMEQVNMNDLLNDALNFFKNEQMKSQANFVIQEMPVIRANYTLIFHLVKNLICNGIKFRSDQYPKIEVSGVDMEREWVFTIKDNGIGIDPKNFEKIFQLFKRLHNQTEYPGTGIGLALCKKVVDKHGGKIWVESAPGLGSTFKFSIPKLHPTQPGIA